MINWFITTHKIAYNRCWVQHVITWLHLCSCHIAPTSMFQC